MAFPAALAALGRVAGAALRGVAAGGARTAGGAATRGAGKAAGGAAARGAGAKGSWEGLQIGGEIVASSALGVRDNPPRNPPNTDGVQDGSEKAAVSLKSVAETGGLVASGFGAIATAAGGAAAGLLGLQDRFSRYSGVIATAQKQRELDAIRRNVKSARSIEDSNAYLSSSFSEFRDATRPITDVGTNMTNYLLGGILNVVTKVLYPVQKGAEYLESVLSWFEGDQEEGEGFKVQPHLRQFLWDLHLGRVGPVGPHARKPGE